MHIVLRGLALLLLALAAGTASAQSTSNQPTTTTLWAGTADFNAFGLASVTNPTAGVILEGTAISQFTGKPVRHMWYGDFSNGLCRVDPEMDDPGVSTVPGIGFHQNIIQTCIATIQAAGFVPTQLAFDPSTNTIYASDRVTQARGIIRLHYIPSGDNGQGTIDPIHVESLMGGTLGRNAAGGCPVVGDPSKVGNPIGAQLASISIGPDGNLYAGWKRGGYIVRILSPATFNPANPDDCANKIQVPLFSADERLGNGHTFGLAWINHDLFGADNIAPWILPNADQCLTPQNGNQRCSPFAATEILAAFVPGPQAGIVSDAIFPSFGGNTLYAASAGSATRIINVANVTSMVLSPLYGGTFCFITGLTVDPIDLANETLYVGVDCTQGAINGAASIYKVVPVPKAPGPPATPVNVSATAGVGAATVNWIPTPDGQPITSFVVRASFVSDGSTVPDVTVNQASNGIAPRTVTVTGLTNGVSYQFEVAAANATGSSSFSAPSNLVTPQALSVPSAPTNVVAIAGNTSATIAWTPSASNGGSPITGQVVTTRINGLPSASVTVGPTVSGANVTGLTNGTAYTFTVHSINALGSSPESAPSVAVIPKIAPGVPDLAITMNAPASINAGSIVTFTMVVTNNGPQDAALVTITDLLPGTFSGETSTQGVCSATGGSFNCNLGGLTSGSSATVTVKVLIGSFAVTNKATVLVRDANGNLLVDPIPGNNSASATTLVNVPAPPPTTPPPAPVAGGGGGAAGGGGGGGAATAGGGGGGGGGRRGGGGGGGGGGGQRGGGGGGGAAGGGGGGGRGGNGGGGGAAGGTAVGGPGAGGFGPGM